MKLASNTAKLSSTGILINSQSQVKYLFVYLIFQVVLNTQLLEILATPAGIYFMA